MMKKNTKKFKAIVGIILIFAVIISSAFALLTAVDGKTNSFTIGDVKIELWEAFDTNGDGEVDGFDDGSYNKKNSADEVYGPDENNLQRYPKMLPGMQVDKKPWLENTGSNDAYMYMMVTIPHFCPEDNPGSIENGIDLFDVYHYENGVLIPGFNLNDWELLKSDIGNSTYIYSSTSDYAANINMPVLWENDCIYYLFAYKQPVSSGETTSSPFDVLKIHEMSTEEFELLKSLRYFGGTLYEEGLLNKESAERRYVNVAGYAIQSDLRNADSPSEAWELYANQENWGNPSGKSMLRFRNQQGDYILDKTVVLNEGESINLPATESDDCNTWRSDSDDSPYFKPGTSYTVNETGTITFQECYQMSDDEVIVIFDGEANTKKYDIKVHDSVIAPKGAAGEICWICDDICLFAGDEYIFEEPGKYIFEPGDPTGLTDQQLVDMGFGIYLFDGERIIGQPGSTITVPELDGGGLLGYAYEDTLRTYDPGDLIVVEAGIHNLYTDEKEHIVRFYGESEVNTSYVTNIYMHQLKEMFTVSTQESICFPPVPSGYDAWTDRFGNVYEGGKEVSLKDLKLQGSYTDFAPVRTNYCSIIFQPISGTKTTETVRIGNSITIPEVPSYTNYYGTETTYFNAWIASNGDICFPGETYVAPKNYIITFTPYGQVDATCSKFEFSTSRLVYSGNKSQRKNVTITIYASVGSSFEAPAVYTTDGSTVFYNSSYGPIYPEKEVAVTEGNCYYAFTETGVGGLTNEELRQINVCYVEFTNRNASGQSMGSISGETYAYAHTSENKKITTPVIENVIWTNEEYGNIGTGAEMTLNKPGRYLFVPKAFSQFSDAERVSAGVYKITFRNGESTYSEYASNGSTISVPRQSEGAVWGTNNINTHDLHTNLLFANDTYALANGPATISGLTSDITLDLTDPGELSDEFLKNNGIAVMTFYQAEANGSTYYMCQNISDQVTAPMCNYYRDGGSAPYKAKMIWESEDGQTLLLEYIGVAFGSYHLSQGGRYNFHPHYAEDSGYLGALSNNKMARFYFDDDSSESYTVLYQSELPTGEEWYYSSYKSILGLHQYPTEIYKNGEYVDTYDGYYWYGYDYSTGQNYYMPTYYPGYYTSNYNDTNYKKFGYEQIGSSISFYPKKCK